MLTGPLHLSCTRDRAGLALRRLPALFPRAGTPRAVCQLNDALGRHLDGLVGMLATLMGRQPRWATSDSPDRRNPSPRCLCRRVWAAWCIMLVNLAGWRTRLRQRPAASVTYLDAVAILSAMVSTVGRSTMPQEGSKQRQRGPDNAARCLRQIVATATGSEPLRTANPPRPPSVLAAGRLAYNSLRITPLPPLCYVLTGSRGERK